VERIGLVDLNDLYILSLELLAHRT
jgi:hypothetical protein